MRKALLTRLKKSRSQLEKEHEFLVKITRRTKTQITHITDEIERLEASE